MKARLDVTTTMKTEPQVTLPRSVLDHLRWKPGDRLVIEDEGGRLVIRLEPLFPRTRLEDVVGSVGYDGPAKTIEEMDAGVEEYFQSRGCD